MLCFSKRNPVADFWLHLRYQPSNLHNPSSFVNWWFAPSPKVKAHDLSLQYLRGLSFAAIGQSLSFQLSFWVEYAHNHHVIPKFEVMFGSLPWFHIAVVYLMRLHFIRIQESTFHVTEWELLSTQECSPWRYLALREHKETAPLLMSDP